MGLYHQFQTTITFANLIPFIHIHAYKVGGSYKAPVKKDLMRTILFQSNHHLKFFIILCVKNDQMRSFFWSVFSCFRTEYGDLLRKSPYSVRTQENTDQKKLRIWIIFTQCSLQYYMI